MRISAFALLLSVFYGAANSAASPGEDAARVIATAELQRKADPALLALLDAEPQIAARAALALGRTKQPEARAALRSKLSASDTTVRAFAAFAEGLLTDSAVLPVEARLARNDASPAVRYAALDAIDRIVGADPAQGTAALAKLVFDVAGHDADATVRGHAALAGVAFRALPGATQRAGVLAAAYAAEADADVRWHEMWALYRGYAFVAPSATLRAGLHDPSDLVRVEAVRALGKRGGSEARALLEPMLGDPSWRVQEQAHEALLAVEKKPFTEHLAALPAGLHLPPADPPDDEPALPRPVTAEAVPAKPSAPGPSDLLPAPPLSASIATTLNGPMPGLHPRVRLRTTKGDLVVRLFPEWAPYTVANFLRLAARGYYDGNRWFRIVPDFVVQSGDPNDNGEGDAGFTLPAEENPVEQRAGIISMGLNYEKNRPVRDSAGAQFYLTISPQPHLDRDFTVFGELESGTGTIARLIESDRIVRVDRLADK
jgi:cyclophilin family peptidyl-prolyl cis-trans isomerase